MKCIKLRKFEIFTIFQILLQKACPEKLEYLFYLQARSMMRKTRSKQNVSKTAADKT